MNSEEFKHRVISLLEQIERNTRPAPKKLAYGKNPPLAHIAQILFEVLQFHEHGMNLDEIITMLAARKVEIVSTNPRKMISTYLDRIISMPGSLIRRSKRGVYTRK